MRDVLPGIIGKIERHQGKVIKAFLPHVLPGVDDPRVVFRTPSLPGCTEIGQVYLWVNFQDNFWHSFD